MLSSSFLLIRKFPGFFSQAWWLWGQHPHWVPQDDGK